MKFSIRINDSTTARQPQSGVGVYTKLLIAALGNNPNILVDIDTMTPLKAKIYQKLNSYNLAPACDYGKNRVDLTIFPNFATWPTKNSGYVATVIHDLTYLYFPDLVETKNLAHLRRVVPNTIKKADFVITVSESVKSELVKEFGIRPDNCIVTPIPPSKLFFKAVDKKFIQATKIKYEINPNKKYIYFIGSLEPRKNLKTLIEAYSLLPKTLKDEYSLILAGNKGWKTESTEATLNKALKNNEDIKHIGFVDQADSPALYQGASLFVMPSFYEGFGIPVLEAMASGTPVVASNIPVLKEVGGSSTKYADPYSPQSFSDAILEALTQPGKNKENLKANVLRYSWDDNTRSIVDALSSLEQSAKVKGS